MQFDHVRTFTYGGLKPERVSGGVTLAVDKYNILKFV